MERMTKVGWFLLGALILGTAPGTAQEAHRLSGAGVAIHNLAGKARIVAGSGSDVVVRITRGGGDASSLRVETGTVGGEATLRVVYPQGAVVYPEMGRSSRTNVRVRGDGTLSTGGRGDMVEIRGSGRGTEAWADLVVEVPAGKRVALAVGAGDVAARGVTADLRLRTGSGSVDAADVRGEVDVDTGSGSVTVAGARGGVRVDTGSGSVALRDVEGPALGVDTGSGNVRASGVRARSVLVDTGSGSVRLDGVTAPDVRVDTGSGSVEITLLQDADNLRVDTGSGSVTVYAPADLGGHVELDTGSGSLDVDFPLRVTTARRTRLVGTVGDGQGTIRIDTGSGSIKLLRR